MPRSASTVALETYHGASTIILRTLDWLLWIIDMLDLLAQPHNSRPYVQIHYFITSSVVTKDITLEESFAWGQCNSTVGPKLTLGGTYVAHAKFLRQNSLGTSRTKPLGDLVCSRGGEQSALSCDVQEYRFVLLWIGSNFACLFS
jgi:hypothetical protein